MILLIHMLFGAMLGQKIANPFWAIILAFLGHYFLDLFPHTEYSVENIEKKQWHKILPDTLKVSADFLLGILFIFIFSNNQPIVYVCALFAILSDGLTLLSLLFSNKILDLHSFFHRKKIHFLSKKNPTDAGGQNFRKEIPFFWKISTQVITIILVILLLKF